MLQTLSFYLPHHTTGEERRKLQTSHLFTIISISMSFTEIRQFFPLLFTEPQFPWNLEKDMHAMYVWACTLKIPTKTIKKDNSNSTTS